MSGIWREEEEQVWAAGNPTVQASSRVASASQARLIPRPWQYTAPAPVLTISFLHPIFQNVSWKLLESWSMFPRALLTREAKNFAAYLWSYSEREHQDSLTLAVCFYQVLRGSFLWLLTLGSPHDLWPLIGVWLMTFLRYSHFSSYLGLV